MKKKPVWKVSPGWNPIIFTVLYRAIDYLSEAVRESEIGDKWEIENDEMTAEEIEALPEHQEW